MVSKWGFKILLLKFLAVVVIALLNLLNSLCTKFCTYATKLSFSCNTMLFSYLNYISIAYFHCSYRYRYSITSYYAHLCVISATLYSYYDLCFHVDYTVVYVLAMPLISKYISTRTTIKKQIASSNLKTKNLFSDPKTT